MVNAGFPTTSRYGFEMVHAPAATFFGRESSSIENLQRIQLVGFFANFRLINRNANTCALSRPATREPIA
jgi:hypothetical protein